VSSRLRKERLNWAIWSHPFVKVALFWPYRTALILRPGFRRAWAGLV